MPKLLIINTTCNQGSTGKISEQVGLMMKNKGWEVYYAHGTRRVNPSQLGTIPIGSLVTEYLHAFISLLFDKSGLGSFYASTRFINQVKKINPDVIHLHNVHGYYINYKLLFNFLKKQGKPIIWTLHDCWPFTGHCAYFDFPKCEKWKNGCGNCKCLRKYPRSLGIDRSKKNYNEKMKAFSCVPNLTLVPVSDWLNGLLNESFLQNYSSKVIHNGIDLTNFKPDFKLSDGIFRVLGVSNVWEPRKGFPDVLLLRKLLPAEYEITLVGLSEAQVSTLPSGIIGITRTENQTELAQLYARSDVLINPTYEDNYPTVNLESLACGTPVVTYRTGGSPESLTPETGIVVEQGNVEALANAIISLKQNPLSSETCRKYAEEHFDKDKCFEKYNEIFDELISQRSIQQM